MWVRREKVSSSRDILSVRDLEDHPKHVVQGGGRILGFNSGLQKGVHESRKVGRGMTRDSAEPNM